MTMNRKSTSKSEAMERMELSNEATRLLNDVQYLRERSSKVGGWAEPSRQCRGGPEAAAQDGA